MLIDVKCKICNQTKEILVKRDEIQPDGSIPPSHELCNCGGELKKVDGLTVGNFQLKGKGWARDNYGLK